MLFDFIVNYYNDESGSLNWKINDYLLEKSEETKDKNSMIYWFWTPLVFIHGIPAFMFPQLFVHPWYKITSRKYTYKVKLSDCEDNILDHLPLVKKWCRNNNLDAFFFYELHLHEAIIFTDDADSTLRQSIGFTSEEDVIAFKLCWG